MTEAEMTAALETGIELASDSAIAGCDLLGFGEMGIGNTTSASAIAAALTRDACGSVVGCGAGADEACMARKRSAIERALALHAASLGRSARNFALRRRSRDRGDVRFLSGRRGASHAGCDGWLHRDRWPLRSRCGICPAASGYLFASHKSVEPGHAHLLAMLEGAPLLDLGMRLGEGTGAALAMRIIQAAVAAFTQMATFASAGVSNK